MITAERLRELLTYDPETGVFRRRIARVGGKAAAGQIAGTIRKDSGARQICLDCKVYLAHRLAWLYMTGKWPKDQIDHCNVNPSDNRWVNLREATPSQNGANKRVQRAGLKGVVFHKQKQKYMAQIKSEYLGLFETEHEAHDAYLRAAKEMYGEFARAA